ncbi:permease [Nocardioides aequoreus]|uniref:permease n=1 Tax=Nocardioides aequoreus TaxID=397278 RepID=UPI00068B2900|nr:permease [Nocardioides aequoreus]
MTTLPPAADEARDAVPAGPAAPDGPHRWLGQPELVVLGLLVLLLAQGWITGMLDAPAVRAWAAMFVAVVVQSLPFLVFGVVVAALISTFLSERLVRRVMPRNPAAAVPVAGVAGVGLVGCECASIPIAGGVMRQGVAPAAALTFLLAAPAVNPVVIASTLVAFPGMPEMALARFVASMATAVAVGWLWIKVGRRTPPRFGQGSMHEHGTGMKGFLASVHHDLMQAAGYVVMGATIAAAVNAFVPRAVLDTLAGNLLVSVVVLALFAFVVALCSQTDAFVAASLTAFSPTAKLVFLVVGPAMDVKLASLEAGYFGRRFAMVFVPLVLVVATVSAVLVGWWLL